MNSDEWLKKMAAIEDGQCVSVGGFLGEWEQLTTEEKLELAKLRLAERIYGGRDK